MTPWAQFKDLDLSKLASVLRNRVLIDPYAIFNANEVIDNGFEYYTLGVSK